MISQRVKDHFFDSYRFDRVYDEHDEPYAIMRRVDCPQTDIVDFGKIPIGSIVVNIERGHVSAWRKLSDYNTKSTTKLWLELPQWKADLLGLACYPFLPDSTE